MLYPKAKEKHLTDELFQNPSREYRATPFWAWNCKLEKDELLRQLEVFKKMGMGGAHMHVRTGLTTPYLSDEHMDLVSACVEKCRQEDMLAWLYDEDRWPSGAAGGIVTKKEAFRARHLLFTTRPYDGSKDIDIFVNTTMLTCRSNNGELLACYDVVLDENGCLQSYRRIGPEDQVTGTKWYVYLETSPASSWFNNQAYVDTMNPAAMQRFIDVTYDRYWETVGKDFGGIVPAIFTDEPQISHKKALTFARENKDALLPWTPDFPKTYSATYGEDILDKLPELLWELPEGVSATRYRYHDHISQRFTEAFADQCGAWCAQHGLMLTGHMMEEWTLENQCGSVGEAMRNYRGFQLPGIDMLRNRTEFTTAKQTQSAVHQYGREGMLSEMYGVTGWDFDFRGHKFQGDWQAALGVTVRVPHLSMVSMKGEAKRDYPASINYQSPWWQDYALVEDHFARVATAMTRGKPVVRVAVIHPIESFWLHYGPADQTVGIRNQMDRDFLGLTDWLINGNIDFDFICESLLPEQCAKGSAPLQVGEMAYTTVVIPNCETLRSSTLERLEAFADAGGHLVFLGDAPKYEDACPSDRGRALWARSAKAQMSKESVLAALEADRLVDIRTESGSRTDNLIHQLRCDGEDRWLFIAHSRADYNSHVPAKQNVRISLQGQYSVVKYDTQTGDIQPLASSVENGKTVIRLPLYDLESLLLRYTARQELPASADEAAVGSKTQIPVPDHVSYCLDEPNVYLLDKAEFALDGDPYQPRQELLRADNVLRAQLGWPVREGKLAQPWVVPEAALEHTARLRFTVFCREELPDICLALEDAALAKISLNGNPITARPEGWFTDKSIGKVMLGTLRQGENTIEVVLPFGTRTGLEWCYLLGSFGVHVQGEYRELTAQPAFLGFDDVTHQGLAHYGSNIIYHFPITTKGGKVSVTVPHFAGAAVWVKAAGEKQAILYPPYKAELTLPAGTHELELTLLGHRQNCFGPVHRADLIDTYTSPRSWRTNGSNWTESYRLSPLGILSAPEITETP